MKEYRERKTKNGSEEDYYPNLISKLKEKNLKISDLAKVLNKNYYLVSRKINGKGEFSSSDCLKICEFLKESFEKLFYSPYKKE